MKMAIDRYGIYWLRKGAYEWKGISRLNCYCRACCVYRIRRWKRRIMR